MPINGERTGMFSSGQTPGPVGGAIDRAARIAGPSNSVQSSRQAQTQLPASSETLSQLFGISDSESPFLLPPDIRLVVEKAKDVVNHFRRAALTKAAAVGEIYEILEPGRNDIHTRERQAAFQQLCEQLEQEHELDRQALTTGRRINMGIESRGQPPEIVPPVDAALQEHIANLLDYHPEEGSELGYGPRALLDCMSSPWKEVEPWSEEQFAKQRRMKLDHSTWRSYQSGFNSWQSFILAHNYPIEPTPTTLANYIMYMCDYIRPSSVISYLSGIVQFLEPFFPNIRVIRNSSLVRDTIIGCKRLHGFPVSRKAPLTLSMLSVMVHPPAVCYNDILFQALLLVGFHALLRLGDLCDPIINSLKNPAKRAKRSSLRFFDQHFTYLLPAHKSDKFFEGDTILVRQLWDSLPVLSTFRTYICMRDRVHPFSSPLWLTRDGQVPTRAFLLQRLQAFNFGPSICGQSMRAGGATALAALQVPPHIIQSLGRWSSEAWKIYIRQHPLLLAQYRQHP